MSEQQTPGYDFDDDFDDDDECPHCGGEGYVYCCFEEWACVDPEGGCDLCMQRCDWCRPSRAALSQAKDQQP